MTWDTTKPAGTRLRSLGDDDIRELKTDLQTAFQAYGHFPINAALPKFQYKGQRGNTAGRPANGAGGIYYDTDTFELLRDNGSAWQRIGLMIPSGTKAFFYQAAAPKGWTIDSGPDARILSVDSAAGGTNAGSSYSITLPANGNHSHSPAQYGTDTSAGGHSWVMMFTGTYAAAPYGYLWSQRQRVDISGFSNEYDFVRSTTISTSTGDLITSSAGTHTHTYHVVGDHQLAKGIIATKN